MKENLHAAQEMDDVSWASFSFCLCPVIVVVVAAPKDIFSKMKIRILTRCGPRDR